jgi:hypothetical protein
MSFYELNWRKGAKCVKLVVGCSFLVKVSVHEGMLTMASSWWGKNVITPISYVDFIGIERFLSNSPSNKLDVGFGVLADNFNFCGQ